MPHDTPGLPQGAPPGEPVVRRGPHQQDALLAGVAAATGPAMVRSERLNLWTDSADEWLPPGLWAARTGPQPANLDGVRITLGVEAVPSWRRATVGRRNHDGFRHVGRCRRRARQHDDGFEQHRPQRPSGTDRATLSEVAAGGPGRQRRPAAAVPYATAAGLATGTEVIPLTPRQIRSASQLLRSELIGHRLTHGPDELLAQQVRVARPSGPLEGGDWYLSIRDSLGEVDAIRSLAWAAWAAISPPAPEEVPQVFV